ncbi:hypothetical protein CEP51_014049 [Fusarium floridanum]|uniref:Uncharacterized protein n=1 Tax=Fusarium floridanum TaxID=1325733 RepID=A0A428Q091_9HYPO|nr:hypothetical protein CEP51_014049 [Fusarium floridanum]
MEFKTEPVKTEPVKIEAVKAERAMKKEEFLAPKRELPSSSHGQAVKAEVPVASSDEDVVFLFTAPRPSARPLGRCSCGSSCNHASSAIATTATIKTDNPSAPSLGSQDAEVIDLVSDEDELPSVGSLQLRAKRARTHSPAFSPPSKRQTLNNYGAPSSSSSSQALLTSAPSPVAPTSWATASSTSPSINVASTSAITRATPKWPLPHKRTMWLKEIKGVYDANPAQFCRHIDDWFEEFETRVRLGRVDDYSNWIALNYGESRCFTGILHAFPNANLTECLQSVDVVQGYHGAVAIV